MTPAQPIPESRSSSHSAPPGGFDADALVGGLEDPMRGLETQLELISMGHAAVPSLTRFLLRLPGPDPRPRVLAVDALGAIGGIRVTRALVAALCRGPIASLAPAVALSEETVRNAAARALGRIGDPLAAGPLLYALRRSHLIEAGKALLRFHDVRAIPALVECLEDPFLRERAMGLLFEFGEDATGALIAGLANGEQTDGGEPPHSVGRREACARILGSLKAGRAEAVLRESLGDPARATGSAHLGTACL